MGHIFVTDSMGPVASEDLMLLAMKVAALYEITWNDGHWAVQGHSRSKILLPIKSLHATSYGWLILTHILSYTVSELSQHTGQITSADTGASSSSVWGEPPGVWTTKFGLKN